MNGPPPPEPVPARPHLTLVLVALVALVAAAGWLVPAPAAADGPIEETAVSAGVFDVLDGVRSAEGGFELRFRSLWEGAGDREWVVRPTAGAMATSEGALYGYAALRLEIPLGERWLLVPQTGGGLYERGDDKDLGGSIHFRSGLELAYALGSRHRVGAVFYHLSNAGLEDDNPGSESLVLYWSWR